PPPGGSGRDGRGQDPAAAGGDREGAGGGDAGGTRESAECGVRSAEFAWGGACPWMPPFTLRIPHSAFRIGLMPHTTFKVGRLTSHALEAGMQHLDGGPMCGVGRKHSWARRMETR